MRSALKDPEHKTCLANIVRYPARKSASKLPRSVATGRLKAKRIAFLYDKSPASKMQHVNEYC